MSTRIRVILYIKVYSQTERRNIMIISNYNDENGTNYVEYRGDETTILKEMKALVAGIIAQDILSPHELSSILSEKQSDVVVVTSNL